MSICLTVKPDLIEVEPGRQVACHLYTTAELNGGNGASRPLTKPAYQQGEVA